MVAGGGGEVVATEAVVLEVGQWRGKVAMCRSGSEGEVVEEARWRRSDDEVEAVWRRNCVEAWRRR